MDLFINFWFIFIAVFVLGFSIFIHELGHYMAARKRGLIADRFSIGFGPRLFGWHYKGTDFRVSLLPLGGYVSLPQLADMGRIEGAIETESAPLPAISYADKMIVLVMGVVFNFLLAFLLSLILWGVGREVIHSTEVGHVAQQIVNADNQIVPGPAFTAGLKKGDTITEIDGQKIYDWMQFQSASLPELGARKMDAQSCNWESSMTIPRWNWKFFLPWFRVSRSATSGLSLLPMKVPPRSSRCLRRICLRSPQAWKSAIASSNWTVKPSFRRLLKNLP